MAIVTDEWGFTEKLENETDQYRKYHREALDILKKGLELFGDGKWGGEWKVNSEDKETGDKVFVRKTEAFGNVYAVSAKIKVDPAKLFRVVWDEYSTTNKWNPTVKEFNLVSQIGSQTQIVNNASEALLGGLVSSRDFSDIRIWRNINNSICLGARTVQCDKVPPVKGRVRAENRLGFFRFTPAQGSGPVEVSWIASIDLKGMLPKSVVERAMNSFLLDYVRYLRKHVETGH